MDRFVACPRCEGRGSHVNPAVDGNGLTAEDVDDLGMDFMEDYLGGLYDVPCERCKGQRVVLRCAEGDCQSPAEENQRVCYIHATPEVRAEIDEIAQMYAIQAAEIAAGC